MIPNKNINMNGKDSRISIIQAYLVTRENVIINLHEGYLFASWLTHTALILHHRNSKVNVRPPWKTSLPCSRLSTLAPSHSLRISG